jgi:hypothetical protein
MLLRLSDFKAGKYQSNMLNGKGDTWKNIYLTKISKIGSPKRR